MSTCKLICWVIGVVAGLVALSVASAQTGFLAALLVAIALAVFLALVLQSLFCGQDEVGADHDDASAVAAPAAKPAVASEPKPEPAPEPKPVPVAEAETTPDYDGDGVLEGEDEGTKPAGLSAARDGKADNLKEIKGIGPKLEAMLNEMGFYHFDQIAGWSAQEIAWVNANLKGFKGRVTRD